MFEAHFGLRTNPFALMPDPSFLFLSERHQNALDLLQYALEQGSAIAVISGEIGCGKTILTRRLVRLLDDTHTIGLINNTFPRMNNIVKWVARAFGIDSAGLDEAEAYELIEQFAIDQYAAGRSCLLIVDEAQNLSAEDLELLRILTNMNVDDHLVMQLLLLGQPNLRDKLKDPELRQLVQRIGVEAELTPLNLLETVDYIRHRSRLAGAPEELFDSYACAGIHHLTGGVPRLINRLCERSLTFGYDEGLKSIDLELVMTLLDEQAEITRLDDMQPPPVAN